MPVQLGPFRFTPPGILVTILALAAFAVLASLGNWQLERARAKEALASARAAAALAEPLALGLQAAGATAAELVDRRAYVRGRYDLDHQYLLDNQVHRGVAGYHVLTPLVPEGGATWVLVNRGWVAQGATRADLPAVPGPVGAVAVRGVLAGPPSTGLLLGDSGYGGGGWPRVVQNVDLPAIEAALGAGGLPVVLRLDPGEPAGFTRDWRVVGGLSPTRHLGYAVQWFALALALLVIYVVVNTQRTGRI